MRKKIRKVLFHFFIFCCFTFFQNVEAQIIIPFSFWRPPRNVSISPTQLYILSGDSYVFSVSGGTGIYNWNLTAGATADGAVLTPSGATAEYSARLTSYTLDTVSVTSGTKTSNAAVVTFDPLAIAPSEMTTVVSSTVSLVASGGCLNGTNCVGGTFTYFLMSGDGSVSATGVYTAPNTPTIAVIEVRDSLGNTAESIINVVNSLTISPANLKIALFSTNIFTATAGTLPYVYSILSGTGTIDSSTGLYTAPSTVGSAVVRVTDGIPNSSNAAVTIIEPVDIKMGQYFACVRYNEGSVKCWGTNNSGQLGIGNTNTIGDLTTEIGGANPFVNLGTGRTATAIDVGLSHACALLDNGTIKCWGNNSFGQLGKGNTVSLGDNANEMGNNLTAVNLGTGRTATGIFVFGNTSCAKLDDQSVKCWGRNNQGQLGLGDTNNRGDNAGEMGDNLPAIDLGTGRTATTIVGGFEHTCALLDNSTVKCWGDSKYGQTGKDTTSDIGDGPNEMGDNLTSVNINGNSGGARTATRLVSGYEHICVIRDNATAICWGRNTNGQAGVGASNGQNMSIGDSGGEMAALASISFPGGYGALSNIWANGFTSCASNASNVIKCWGRNNEGQFLHGNATSSDNPTTSSSSLGTGLVISKLDSEFNTACALFTNKRIKCWGRATNGGGTANGILLNGAGTNNLGDANSEIGDNLPYVNH